MKLQWKPSALAAVVAVLLHNPFAQAQESADLQGEKEGTNPLRPFLAGGLTFGGDDLIEVQFSNSSNETLEAGGLIDLKAGLIYDMPESPWSLQGSIGYHFDSIDAENGDASINRYPLELLGFYNTEKHRFGGGLSYHMSPEFEVDLLGMNGTVEFDDAVGLALEYGFKVNQNCILALRGVFIDYEVSDLPGAESISANHAGAYVYLVF